MRSQKPNFLDRFIINNARAGDYRALLNALRSRRAPSAEICCFAADIIEGRGEAPEAPAPALPNGRGNDAAG